MLITHWKENVWSPDLAHRVYRQFYEWSFSTGLGRKKFPSFSYTGTQEVFKCPNIKEFFDSKPCVYLHYLRSYGHFKIVKCIEMY